MSLFSSKTKPVELAVEKQTPEEQRLVEETFRKLEDEKQFWDDVVKYADADNEVEATRAIATADRLLEARRVRFPQ